MVTMARMQINTQTSIALLVAQGVPCRWDETNEIYQLNIEDLSSVLAPQLPPYSMIGFDPAVCVIEVQVDMPEPPILDNFGTRIAEFLVL
jgi:sensor domain CHASE-containing protein